MCVGVDMCVCVRACVCVCVCVECLYVARVGYVDVLVSLHV